VVAALSDLLHQKRFGFYFFFLGSQFREVAGALVKGSRSFGQSRSKSFGQKPQQELWSKAAT